MFSEFWSSLQNNLMDRCSRQTSLFRPQTRLGAFEKNQAFGLLVENSLFLVYVLLRVEKACSVKDLAVVSSIF